MNMIFAADTASLNISTPNIEVPAMPIPVHTAYATDSDSFFSASDKHTKLRVIPIIVNMLGSNFEKPCVNFSPIAHDTSNSPAMNNIIQLFIFYQPPLFTYLLK